jgi:NAD+ synthase
VAKETKEIIAIDPTQEIERISDFMRSSVGQKLQRRGAVVGISGGIDSSVVLALCVRAFGPDRTVALIMPEKESSPESAELAQLVAYHYEVDPILENITPILESLGCYSRRDKSIKRIFPEYDAEAGYKAKIVLPGSLLEENTLNLFSLVVVDPDGTVEKKRLPRREFLEIVAASNFKQRTRMSILNYYGELNHFAIIGTANKDEHDLGFFVKYGDGGVDVMPIAHLFKTQVYQLARALDTPDEILSRSPTTDTYSADATQEEFFFRLPFIVLDAIWRGSELGISDADLAKRLNLQVKQVRRVLDDIRRKNRTTTYLRTPPLTITKEST